MELEFWLCTTVKHHNLAPVMLHNICNIEALYLASLVFIAQCY